MVWSAKPQAEEHSGNSDASEATDGFYGVRTKPLKKRRGLSRYYASKSQSFSSFEFVQCTAYGDSALALAKRPSSFDLECHDAGAAAAQGVPVGTLLRHGPGSASDVLLLGCSPPCGILSPTVEALEEADCSCGFDCGCSYATSPSRAEHQQQQQSRHARGGAGFCRASTGVPAPPADDDGCFPTAAAPAARLTLATLQQPLGSSDSRGSDGSMRVDAAAEGRLDQEDDGCSHAWQAAGCSTSGQCGGSVGGGSRTDHLHARHQRRPRAPPPFARWSVPAGCWSGNDSGDSDSDGPCGCSARPLQTANLWGSTENLIAALQLSEQSHQRQQQRQLHHSRGYATHAGDSPAGAPPSRKHGLRTAPAEQEQQQQRRLRQDGSMGAFGVDLHSLNSRQHPQGPGHGISPPQRVFGSSNSSSSPPAGHFAAAGVSPPLHAPQHHVAAGAAAPAPCGSLPPSTLPAGIAPRSLAWLAVDAPLPPLHALGHAQQQSGSSALWPAAEQGTASRWRQPQPQQT